MEGLKNENDIYDGNMLGFDNYVCNLHFFAGCFVECFYKDWWINWSRHAYGMWIYWWHECKMVVDFF